MKVSIHNYFIKNNNYFPYLLCFNPEFLKKVITNKRGFERNKKRTANNYNLFRLKKAVNHPIKKRWSKRTKFKFLD